MTTDEFVENVNGLDNRDEFDTMVSNQTGSVLLSKCGDLIAALGKHDIEWNFVSATHAVTIPPKILKLMVELAESREDDNRYVILNGKPIERWLRHSTTYKKYFIWHFFQIGDAEEWLKGYTTSNPELLIGSAYTLEQLEDKKQLLPEKWRDAIDNMLTPLDVALQCEEHDVDKPDYGLAKRVDHLEELIEEMEDKK